MYTFYIHLTILHRCIGLITMVFSELVNGRWYFLILIFTFILSSLSLLLLLHQHFSRLSFLFDRLESHLHCLQSRYHLLLLLFAVGFIFKPSHLRMTLLPFFYVGHYFQEVFSTPYGYYMTTLHVANYYEISQWTIDP